VNEEGIIQNMNIRRLGIAVVILIIVVFIFTRVSSKEGIVEVFGDVAVNTLDDVVSTTSLDTVVSGVKDTNIVQIGEHAFEVEVVDTNEKRQLGLSDHTSLEPMHGMLFVFEESGKKIFWMKDMDFAIDIVWIDEQGNIIHTEHNVSPDTYPRTFSADGDAMYVLELPANTMRNLGISDGEKVEFYRE